MSKQSSLTANAKPNTASEHETVVSVSNPISLTELATSLEALSLEVDEGTTIVHRTQTSSPLRPQKRPHLVQVPNSRDMPFRCGWRSKWVLDYLFHQTMIHFQSIMQWRLLIELTLGAQGCTWVRMVTCWPSMVERVALGLALRKMLRWRSAGL